MKKYFSQIKAQELDNFISKPVSRRWSFMVICITTFYADEGKVSVKASEEFSWVYLPVPLWFHPYVHPIFIIISVTIRDGMPQTEITMKDNEQKLSYQLPLSYVKADNELSR